MGDFITFVKRHWKAYLVGAIIALTIGFAAAYMVYSVGTTPEEPTAQTTSQEG